MIFARAEDANFFIARIAASALHITSYRSGESRRAEIVKSLSVPLEEEGKLYESAVSPLGTRFLLAVSSDRPSTERVYVLNANDLSVMANLSFASVSGWFRWLNEDAFEYYAFGLDPDHKPVTVTRYRAPDWEANASGQNRVPFQANILDKSVQKAVTQLKRHNITKPAFWPLYRGFEANNFGGSYAITDVQGTMIVVFGHVGRPETLSVHKANVVVLDREHGWRPRTAPGTYTSCRFLYLWRDLIIFGTNNSAGSEVILGFDRASLRRVFEIEGSKFLAKDAVPSVLRSPDHRSQS